MARHWVGSRQRFARRRGASSGTELLAFLEAILVTGALLLGPGCQRPPV
jgi:hypothetical protein